MESTAHDEKRIAFCLPAFDGGGMEQVTLLLIEGLVARGYQVDLILERKVGAYISRLPASVRVIELERASKFHAYAQLISACPGDGVGELGKMLWPGRDYLPLRRLPALVGYLRKTEPAILVAAHGRTPLLAIWAREIAAVDTRIIVVEHSTPSRWLEVFRDRPAMHRRWQYRHALASRLYPKADAVAGVSEGVCDDLAATLGLNRSLITTLYNPVVSDQLLALAAEDAPHAWFGDDQPPVILAAGRLVREKNFAALISAFAKLREGRQKPVRLMIIGEGEERDALQAQIEGLALEDEVSLPGWIDNPYAYMRSSAVFVMCSLFEGLGIVLIEAMACGCPVVATDCPSGPREILDGGRYGPLVPMHDTQALARAIAATLDARPDAALPTARAEMFSVDNALAAYQALIARVLGGKPGLGRRV